MVSSHLPPSKRACPVHVSDAGRLIPPSPFPNKRPLHKKDGRVSENGKHSWYHKITNYAGHSREDASLCLCTTVPCMNAFSAVYTRNGWISLRGCFENHPDLLAKRRTMSRIIASFSRVSLVWTFRS